MSLLDFDDDYFLEEDKMYVTACVNCLSIDLYENFFLFACFEFFLKNLLSK